MTPIAIRADSLSKQYSFAAHQPAYRTLRDTLGRTLSAPARRLRSALGRKEAGRNESDNRHFWALNGVSFEVSPGEIVGVIGRNGSGKSTLLKVLARVTEPTAGYAEIRGRVGALLEVGTGFHGELTGRENIFLSGAILGMKRAEITRKFDEIVSFAGVEKFIDTPCKYYSSGMFLRLGFAVAAHLDTDILLVDEVLAVGDFAFQQKCLGTMTEAAHQGRTVLFVSHNMGAVRALCRKGLLLNQGKLIEFGDIAGSLETYHRMFASAGATPAANPGGTSIGPVTLVGESPTAIGQGEPFQLRCPFHASPQMTGFAAKCVMEDVHQRLVFRLSSTSHELGLPAELSDGENVLRVNLPSLWLEPGVYSVRFSMDFWGHSGRMECHSDPFYLDVIGESGGASAVVHPRATWAVN